MSNRRDKHLLMQSYGGRGFTLIELMVVIVILGILATIVVPRMVTKTEEAKRTKARADIEAFSTALAAFRLHAGFYPSTEQGLQALVQAPTTGRIPQKYQDGGYLGKPQIPNDPWGNPYVYVSPGTHSKDFDIVSYGADGQEGGTGDDADIQSWSYD